MIKLVTNCEECIHNKICKFKNNAKTKMEYLKKIEYHNGFSNDVYDWETELERANVDVTFSCRDFRKEISFDKPNLRG